MKFTNFLKKYQWLIATAGAAALLAAAFSKKEEIKTFVNNTVSNMNSEKLINSLHPAAREAARKFLNLSEAAGMNLIITSGYRTHAQQNELYAKGRNGNTEKKVTNAKGGQSMHNFGLAIDVVEIRNGKALWEEKDGANWNRIAQIGKAAGFAWGGDFKSFVDKPHFQMTFGLSLAQLQTKYATGQIENGYILLT